MPHSMPVQFSCSQCRRALSVGQRKIGATVACPKCGAANVVPSPEPATALQAASVSSPAAAAIAPPDPASADSPAFGEAVAFDDIPNLIAMIDSMPAAPPSSPRIPDLSSSVAPSIIASPPPVVGPPAPSPEGFPSIGAQAAFGAALSSPRASRNARPRPAPRDEALLLISRKTVYAQAVLMAVVALAALVAGYLIGRGARRESTDSSQLPAANSAEGYVTMEGDASAIPITLLAPTARAGRVVAGVVIVGGDERF